MKYKYVLTIKAKDRPGLLQMVTGMLDRRQAPVLSLTVEPTDVHEIVLISIETELTDHEATTLALKLENVVEVFSVDTKVYDEETCLRAAWCKLDLAFLDTPKAAVLTKYGAVIVQWYPNAFLVAKYGTDKAIRELYNQLDGPQLFGFSQTGLINDSRLIDHDNDERIIWLAA